jgi:hypothetical protein
VFCPVCCGSARSSSILAPIVAPQLAQAHDEAARDQLDAPAQGR